MSFEMPEDPDKKAPTVEPRIALVILLTGALAVSVLLALLAPAA